MHRNLTPLVQIGSPRKRIFHQIMIPLPHSRTCLVDGINEINETISHFLLVQIHVEHYNKNLFSSTNYKTMEFFSGRLNQDRQLIGHQQKFAQSETGLVHSLQAINSSANFDEVRKKKSIFARHSKSSSLLRT